MKRLTVVNLDAFKQAAKVLGRSMGLGHCRSLDMLSLAHGYGSYHEVVQHDSTGPQQRVALLSDQSMWEEQVRRVFGEVSIGALQPEAPTKFFKRICVPLEQSPEGAEIYAFEKALSDWERNRRSGSTSVPVTYKTRRRKILGVASTASESLSMETSIATVVVREKGVAPVLRNSDETPHMVAQLRRAKDQLDREIEAITEKIDLEMKRQAREAALATAQALIEKYSIRASELVEEFAGED